MALLERLSGTGNRPLDASCALGLRAVFGHVLPVKKLGKAVLDVIRYLESNLDSTPDYGKRYRAGIRIST